MIDRSSLICADISKDKGLLCQSSKEKPLWGAKDTADELKNAKSWKEQQFENFTKDKQVRVLDKFNKSIKINKKGAVNLSFLDLFSSFKKLKEAVEICNSLHFSQFHFRGMRVGGNIRRILGKIL